uniref:Uncharacterized protein n=1 Tax=Oryza brachyantha TaxID=4533 RepID=J3KVD3_ORYBR
MTYIAFNRYHGPKRLIKRYPVVVQRLRVRCFRHLVVARQLSVARLSAGSNLAVVVIGDSNNRLTYHTQIDVWESSAEPLDCRHRQRG